MLHSSRVLVAALAVLASASLTSAQLVQNQAKVRFYEPSGNPLSVDFFVVRDASGERVQPRAEFGNTWAFERVGRKLSFEPTRKGLKYRGFDILLEDAPVVYISMLVDPETGMVKYVKQKAQHPPVEKKRGRAGRPGSGQVGLAPLVPPVNDACASALPIFDGVTAFSTVDATTDGAPVPFGQYDGQTYEDIWYIYTPTCNGTLTVSTCGTASYDTDLVLYEADTDSDGDFDALDAAAITSGAEVALAANDDAGICAGFTSVVATVVAADKKYIVRVGGFGPGDEGTGTLLLSCGGAPSNDICTAPRDLTCGTSLQVTNIAATTAFADPDFSCAFGGAAQGDGTLWFRFTATTTSAYLTTASSIGVTDTLLAVYDGNCGSLVELACNDDISGANFLSEVCVKNLTIGEDYLVQVASYPGASLGRITIDLECPGPCEVPCDDVLAACDIPCGGTTTVDNSNASTDPLDPTFSCRVGGAAQGFGTLWFTFVATATSAEIDTIGSAVDTLLAVYSGTPGSFTELACSDDAVGLQSQFCVDGLTIGQTYYVQAASYSAFGLGDITVNIACPCPEGLPNDECEGAVALGALPASIVFDTTDATDDITTPCGVGSGPFKNVWYSVVGTGNDLIATTCNAGNLVSDTKISVFCGTCLAPICVDGNDDQDFPDDPMLGFCGFNLFDSAVRWCSQPGATYLITVGTFSSFTSPGIIQLDVAESGAGACEAEVQCLPTGACCLPDGSCVTTTEGDCAAQGGDYAGDGTSCTTEFVVDGGFEDGAFAGNWTEFSTNFFTPLCDASCGFNGGAGPHSGDWYAWFGGIPLFEEGQLDQLVTIPVGATTLDFWLEIPASSGNGVDFLEVEIDGTQVFEVFEDDAVYAGTGYNLVSIPLGGFADGGVHTLTFHSIITGVPLLSNFSVDDVSIEVETFDCIECFTLDFETDDTGGSLIHGQRIDVEFDGGPNYPVTITGSSNLASCGTLPNTLAILNSSTGPAAQDPDLLVGSGNILILETDQDQAECAPGVYCSHNDDDDGGTVLFSFVSPIEATSIDLIDIDNSGPDEEVTIILTDGDGDTRTYTVPMNWTGDFVTDLTGQETLLLNTLAPQPGFGSIATAVEDPGFDPTDVVSIEVISGDDCPGSQGGSGAIDNLLWCQ